MKGLLLCVLVLAGIAVSGCTMTETPSERCRRIQTDLRWNCRQFNEDWDTFWLAEKPSYMTPWHLRAGLPD